MSNPESALRLAKRLGYALKRAQHALRMRMDAALRPLGLTTPQYAALSAIEQQPGISSAALARAVFVTAQTMQGILANLAREGLLERAPDPDHGRRLRTELTARGRATLKRAHAAVAGVEAAMTDVVGDAEADRLAALLTRCAERLSAAPDA
jgi:DNA-binding MarR family transcriptional regulator